MSEPATNVPYLFASFSTIPFLGGLESVSVLFVVSGDSNLTVQFVFAVLSGLSTGERIGLAVREDDGEGGTDNTRGVGGGLFKWSKSVSESGKFLNGHGVTTGQASLLSSLWSIHEFLLLCCLELFPERSSLLLGMESDNNILTTVPDNPVGEVIFNDEFKDGFVDVGEGTPDEF
jgi:hypothetical protein